MRNHFMTLECGLLSSFESRCANTYTLTVLLELSRTTKISNKIKLIMCFSGSLKEAIE